MYLLGMLKWVEKSCIIREFRDFPSITKKLRSKITKIWQDIEYFPYLKWKIKKKKLHSNLNAPTVV